MSVERDHSVPLETPRSSAVRGLTAAIRATTFTALLIAGGGGHAPIINASHSSTTEAAIPETGSIIDNEIVIISKTGKRFTVSAERWHGDLSVRINGKLFDIRDDVQIPGLRPGEAVDDITIGPESLTIHSTLYGKATVRRSELERACETLTQSKESTVYLSVEATVDAKEGTMVALYLRWNTPKTFDIAFVPVGTDPAALFAMVSEQ